MPKLNKLIIAAAGSGKTTYLVEEALKKKDSTILITTYTQANEEEIRRKFFKLNKSVPSNVSIQTWFSFLLQHGARPFHGCIYDEEIKGLVLSNGQSAKGIAETNTKRHYFSENNKIYSDKLSKFIVNCNSRTSGAVIDRLSRIYTDIFIDEVQDLAGYDLELLKLLSQSPASVLLVGDPRQGTYSTNNSSKNKKYSKSKIVNFFDDQEMLRIQTDDSSLTVNYRSCPEICGFSNKLYPTFRSTTSGSDVQTSHDGVFFIKKKDIDKYLLKYNPVQLRWDSKTTVAAGYSVLNFGLAKGLEFERVLIYPTPQFTAWLKDNNAELAPTSRSKFYVAITRAHHSVGIVCSDDDDLAIDGIENWLVTELVESVSETSVK
jgi:DNA helicase II / ATP-dependent DNA helicase PcrA